MLTTNIKKVKRTNNSAIYISSEFVFSNITPKSKLSSTKTLKLNAISTMFQHTGLIQRP